MSLKVAFGGVQSPRTAVPERLECVDPVFVGDRDALRTNDLPRDFARAFGRTLLDRPRFGSRDALSFSISAKINAFLSSSFVLSCSFAPARPNQNGLRNSKDLFKNSIGWHSFE